MSKKIEALEKYLNKLENSKTKYNWNDCDSCNAGGLAKLLMNGRTPRNTGVLDSKLLNKNALPISEQAYCMTSDLPMPKVYQIFKNNGFTYQDIANLEGLSSKEVCKYLGWKRKLVSEAKKKRTYILNESHHYIDNRNDLITYLKAWIYLLKEEEKLKIPEVIEKIKETEKVRYVPVLIDKEILQQEIVHS